MRVRGYIKHRLRLVSDGRGSGSSMPSPASSQTPPWTGTREKRDGALQILKRKRVRVCVCVYVCVCVCVCVFVCVCVCVWD